MVVYADVLFLINFISAYALLYLLGKFIVKTKLKKWRLLFASGLGAVAAVVQFSLQSALPLEYLLRISTAVIMVFIAFYEQKRQILTHIIWLFALSAILIAAMIAIALISGMTTGAVFKAGVVYFDLPQKIFLPMIVISFAAVTIFMKLVQKKRIKRLHNMIVTHRGKKIFVTALFDSGNLLKEPITGRCVCLVEWDSLRELFDGCGSVEDIISHIEEIQLFAVPYRTVGVQSGIIYSFLPDCLELTAENRIIENTLIGIYDGKLSKRNEYNALMNAEMM